ncbi:MAG TPA: DoxX family protein [Chitinophagaceae bacterium]|nr:DoxX family protein [Chitinophagaceae bacterium]
MKKLYSATLIPGLVHFSLLIIRISTGLLILPHGLIKLMHFHTISWQFADPLNIGPEISLLLVIIAEVICPVFLIIGLFTRVAVLPLLIEMLVILIKIYHYSPILNRELDWHYLTAFLVILCCGPGKFSADGWLSR